MGDLESVAKRIPHYAGLKPVVASGYCNERMNNVGGLTIPQRFLLFLW